MSGFNDYGTPGLIAKLESAERVVTWGDVRLQVTGNAQIASTVVDSRSSPTSQLQPGLLLGQKTSDSLYYIYNPDGTDGTEVAAAIIKDPMSMLNAAGVAADKNAAVLLAGLWKASEIQGLDLQARKQLAGSGRVIFDDDIQAGPAFLGGYRSCKNVITNTTVVAADNGALFVATTANTEFTLPTLAIGLVFEFLMAADFELKVTSVALDDVILGGDAAGDGVIFTTAGEQVGAMVRVESIYVGTTLKWLFTLPYSPFNTGLNTLTFSLVT